MNTATQTVNWVDKKRYLWLLSPMLPVLGLAILGTYIITGVGWTLWGGPIIVYGLIPLLDRIIGSDPTNPPESAVAHLESDSYYRFIVYAYIPSQFVLTIWGAYIAATGQLSWFEFTGLVLSVGVINGIAINTAHELSHKRDEMGRWMAKITLAPVAYGHFYVEHVRGHHKNVATPDDPASSKMGESFWAFLPRTMIGSVKSAWKIEGERLGRLGKGTWTFANDNLQAWAMTVVLFALLTWAFGWVALLFLVLQAFYGASLLEVINYMEHYGLLRQKGADGRYERCMPEHSWNSNHIVTNLVLYQLQRHSDHHAHPTRSFQALRHFETSPQLPSGYASMLLPAYIPPLWFRQMDPLVSKHYKGDLSRANILPSKRDAILSSELHRVSEQNPAYMPPIPEGAPTDIKTDGHARFQCSDCGYIYDEAKGCPQEGFPAGTVWAKIPDTWPCPDCAVREKVDFIALNV